MHPSLLVICLTLQHNLSFLYARTYKLTFKFIGRPILKGTLNSGPQQMPPLAFLLNNDMQQIHQQKLKSMQPTEIINNEIIHVGPPPHQNVPYADGISQMQQHHYIQQQQQRSQPPRHRLLHGDMHRQTNLPMQTLPMAGN